MRSKVKDPERLEGILKKRYLGHEMILIATLMTLAAFMYFWLG